MTERVHLAVGSPWQDAVIRHLEPQSPYRPWPAVPDVRENDVILVVFDTEPRLVLSQIARIGADCDVDSAIAALHREWMSTGAVRLSSVGAEVDDQYALKEGANAARLVAAVERQRFTARREDRFGHSSVAAARTLLESDGRCTGCSSVLDLVSSVPTIRTVDSAEDWPATLCPACQIAMLESGFDTFLDYRFSVHRRAFGAVTTAPNAPATACRPQCSTPCRGTTTADAA